jgi:hypothetical protein
LLPKEENGEREIMSRRRKHYLIFTLLYPLVNLA